MTVNGRRCLVVGAGAAGTLKASGLVRGGAHVTVVSPDASEQLRALADAGQLRWERRRYEDRDLDGVFLVAAVTSDLALNAAIYEAATARGTLTTVSANHPAGDVTFTASEVCGPLTLSARNEPSFPALSRWAVDTARASLGPAPEALVDAAHRARAALRANGVRPSAQRWADGLSKLRTDMASEAIDASPARLAARLEALVR